VSFRQACMTAWEGAGILHTWISVWRIEGGADEFGRGDTVAGGTAEAI
jgi:hypothetical protein